MTETNQNEQAGAPDNAPAANAGSAPKGRGSKGPEPGPLGTPIPAPIVKPSDVRNKPKGR